MGTRPHRKLATMLRAAKPTAWTAPPSKPFRSNDGEQLRAAVLAGLGITQARLTGSLRPTYAPEPCGESCAIVSRPEFRSAPCDPRPAVSPAKSPCLLTFWLSCSPKRTTDLFPPGIDTIRTQRLIPLVTGGTRGIGAAVARRFQLAGARVVATARSASAHSMDGVSLIPADIGTAAGADSIVSRLTADWGGLRHPGQQRWRRGNQTRRNRIPVRHRLADDH